MSEQATLVYFSSDIIKDFVKRNPIDWGHKCLANGPGNIKTPTSAMEVFFSNLHSKKKLFTQKEYATYAWEEWKSWKKKLTKRQIQGVEARLYRNFYPSAIDSLYVWSMLVETDRFALCTIDIAEDVYSKTDLTVWSKNKDKYKIALHVDSEYCKKWTKYKKSVRGKPVDVIDVVLTMDRPRKPGNKRWYTIEDLEPLLPTQVLEEST